MTAGRGIIHSEMPEQQNGLLEGFQLWVNLPAEHKMDQPDYQEYSAEQIPLEIRDGAEVRVITGTTCQGTAGPVVQPLTEPLYLDVSLQPGKSFSEMIAEDHNAFIYGIEGESLINSASSAQSAVGKDQLAILTQGDEVRVIAGEHGSRFLLISGKPLREAVVRGGPFVMNTHQQLREAMADYQSGNF